MRNRAIVVGVSLAVVGGIGAALISAFGAGTTNAEAGGTQVLGSETAQAGKCEVVSPTTPDGSREAVEKPDAVVEPPSVGVSALSDAAEKLAASKVYEQDDRTLDQKYAGATLSQLVAAESLLKERRDSDRDRIFKELIAANRLVDVPRNADGEFSIPGNKDGSPVSSIQTVEFVNGVNVVKAAVISGEEYPDYRALELEVWWLQCKVHVLKKQAKVQELTSK